MTRKRRLWRSSMPLVTVALYVLLAIVSTWPLVLAPTRKLPVGDSLTVTVPLFNVWAIWWNADRAAHGFEDYWDAPIFFPHTDGFAFSEPQLMTVLVAPVIWATSSRLLAYNLYLLISLVLNGLFARWLLRSRGIGESAALIGGAAMVLLPIIHWQIDVVQLIPLWGILWTWSALLRLTERPSLLRGVECGVAFTASVAMSIHHSLFLSLLIIGAGWVLVRRWKQRQFWLASCVAIATAAVTTAPLLLPLYDTLSGEDFVRPAKTVEKLSAEPQSYLHASGRPLVNFSGLFPASPWRLNPGWWKVLFACVGTIYGLSRRRLRRWTGFLVLVAILSFVLSLGPTLSIAGWQPWLTMSGRLPGLAQVRNVFRFAYFVQMVAVLLAAQGLYAIVVWKSACAGRARWRTATRVATCLLGALIVLEVRPEPVTFARIEPVARHADWISFIREQTPEGQPILCLPVASGDLIQDFEPTVRWMYWATFHKVPLINGYSGFFPKRYFELRDEVNANAVSEELADHLDQIGTAYIVVDTSSRDSMELMRLDRVFAGRAGIDVYRSHIAEQSQADGRSRRPETDRSQ